MSIELAGGVYCPLSPKDPEQRLQTLIEQTQSRFVFVHSLTQDKFSGSSLMLDIETILNDNITTKNINVERFSNTNITSDSIAYTIFTSGTTGIPKAVSFLIHNSFLH
jgi:N-(5-amino-5-carboxypentanoyl)-L-cysteinyl-D-valine synthase